MLNGKNDFRWWEKSDQQVHESVFALVDYFRRNQNYRTSDYYKYMRLYGNFDFLGLGFNSTSLSDFKTSIPNNRVTLNIIQSMVDTVVSKITKNRPKATFLTQEGDWSLQEKAKKLSKFIEGQFLSCNIYDISTKMFQDSCIFGTGAIKMFIKDGQIKVERVFIDEIMVDDVEAVHGKPRQLHQRKYIPRDVLKAMFPKDTAAIDLVKKEKSLSRSEETVSDMVQVIESWHLPSKKGAGDGKHTLCIRNKTLMSNVYDKEYFPFVFMRWNERPLGFFGQGLAEQLTGLQLEINKILRTIQISMHLTSIPKVFVEKSSKVVTSHLNNQIGGIVEYVGTKPSYESVGSIPPELFNHLDRLYQRAFEIAGISQLSAQSLKPSGLDSGKALREFSDIESERFHEVAKRYEDMFLETAKNIIRMSKELYEDMGELQVKVKGEDFIETIDWSEVDMEEDKYLMQIFPTNSLSSTPSGRLQDIQELLQAGFISREDGLRLLDFPDLKAVTNKVNAPIENLEKTISIMMDKGRYLPPEPYQDLQGGIARMQQAYLMFKNQSAPESRLELLRRWIEDAGELLKRAQAEQQRQALQAEAQAQEQLALQQAQKQQEQQLQQDALLVQEAPLEQPLSEEELQALSQQAVNPEDLI